MKLDAAKGLFSTFASFERRDLGGMVHGVTDLFHVASGRTQKANQYTRATRSSVADVVRWLCLHMLCHINLVLRCLGVVARTPRRVLMLKSVVVTQVP